MRNDLISALEGTVKVVTDPLFASYQMYRFDVGENDLELRVQVGENRNERTLVLRVVVDPSGKVIGIPNIFVPMDLKYQGHGKRIISRILEVANLHDYSLYVIDLVPNFHRRLVARGAILIDDETVQITEKTRLVDAAT